MANSASIEALRREAWGKELWADAIDDLFLVRRGLMGDGENYVVSMVSDLAKAKGDTYTFGLTAKLTGNGVTGDNELEGNEEAIQPYSESILIDQIRFGVRLQGNLDEQKAAYDMRMDAREKLKIQLQEFIERQVFLKLGGVTNVLVNDVNGVTVAANASWSNTPDLYPQADTAAGTGNRYICANSSGADALTANDLFTPTLIDRAKAKAMLASPKILPLRIDGKDYYVIFIHPWQAYDLRQNAQWAQAQREAQVRGDMNPIFTGALGIWNGVIVYEHEYVPFLDASVAGHNFNASGSGTDYAVDAFRALFCGRRAAAMLKCNNPNEWVEKKFDYDNKTGFSTGLIGGIQKVMFNSKEYGVIAIDTAATAL